MAMLRIYGVEKHERVSVAEDGTETRLPPYCYLLLADERGEQWDKLVVDELHADAFKRVLESLDKTGEKK